MNQVRQGIYRHYKNNLYLVMGTATHTETQETLVFYRSLYGDFRLWARPAKMFLEQVEVEGKLMNRFTWVENPDEKVN